MQSFLEHGPLPADVATELISQALEVSEVLSQVFAEEAVWVETGLSTIIVGSQHSGRGFTFWISPQKWLGGREKSRGLESIVTLTEEVMGWRGRNMNDQEGHGLGGWLKWMRQTAGTISLREARETLAAAVGEDPPVATEHLVVQASRPRAQAGKPSSSKVMLGVNICLTLLVIGLAGWFFANQRALRNSRPLAGSPPANPTNQQPASDHGGQGGAADANGGVIHWASRELLLQHDGEEVVVEGVLEGISSKNARMYLLFSQPPVATDPRGAVVLKTAAADLAQDALTPLIGKKVRLRGTVNVVNIFGSKRPEILIKDRASIEAGE